MRASTIAFAVMAALPAASAAAPDDRKAVDARVEAALRQMTDQEKQALLHGRMLAMSSPASRPPGIPMGGGYVPGVPRLGIPPLVENDASLGVANLLNMRRGDVATALPSGLALAAAWDPDLVLAAGRMIGGEARAKGFNVMLAGGVNLARDPRNGRNFEYLGEDPLLAGLTVAAQISGIQSNHIIATIKHFALNDQETGRSSASANLAEAPLRESDLLAFQIGIEGGQPGAVMCAYNRVNTVFACENPFLLDQVLRRDWGYRGFVMSDWGAVHSLASIRAGLDQQSGEQIDNRRWYSTELTKALATGEIAPSAIDTAARRILRAIFSNRLAPDPRKQIGPIDYAANAALAQHVAEQGVVLLRNEQGMLPLAKSTRRILVVGGHADLGVLSGGGSSQVVPVGGFKLIEKGPGGAGAGFVQIGYGGTSPLEGLRQQFPGADVSYLDGRDTAAVVTAARSADAVVVIASKFSSEAIDNADLALGNEQDSLITTLAAANPRTVVVLQTGNPVLMPWRDKVPAILAAWYPGQRGGLAIARVLSGAVNPAGRLPITFPAGIEQLPNPVLPGSTLPPPSAQDRAVYGVNVNSPAFDITYPEGSDVGYRWYARNRAVPLYPFGFGLSYTRFGYDRLTVRSGRRLSVRWRVTNLGPVTGQDVPQVYATMPGKAPRLVGWRKLELRPGESRVVGITVDPRLLAHFDAARQLWVVEPQSARIEVAHAAGMPELASVTAVAAAELHP